MFTKKPPTETELDRLIDITLADIRKKIGANESTEAAMAQLSMLYKLKREDAPERVSKDTMAMIAANLAGIFMIVNYEHAHVATSKALGLFVKALR